jgi:tetratricopeptide (TPR) repeat protein
MASRLNLFAFLLLAALLACAGCGGDNFALSAETDEPLYREGQQLEKQGRTQEALTSYLKVIGKRGDMAPESHLEAGLIYLKNIEDPIAAIYHFRKYLELDPNSRLAAQVRGLIDTAKLKFASTLPAKPLENEVSGLESSEQVARLQKENDELRAELTALHPGGGSAAPHAMFDPPAAAAAVAAASADDDAPAPVALASVPAEDDAAPAPAARQNETQASPAQSGRTHTVARGDTLSNLAQRYYGTRAKAKVREIVAANRDKLSSESSPLKIGAVLKIP